LLLAELIGLALRQGATQTPATVAVAALCALAGGREDLLIEAATLLVDVGAGVHERARPFSCAVRVAATVTLCVAAGADPAIAARWQWIALGSADKSHRR
jgi:hypothetical protein